MMRRVIAAALLLASTSAQASESGAADSVPAAAARPRLIVLTDIGNEPDDSESMVRLLTYANEIELEGLVASTSRHLPDRVNTAMIERRVAAYGQVLGNLRAHDPRYPDAAALSARIRAAYPAAGMAAVGKGKDSPASRLIVETVDKADARPVWVAVWGGAAPLAQALWHVRATRSPAAVARFVDKLRVYSISDQDDSGPWARATFPKLFWIASIHGPTQYELAAWTGISAEIPGADQVPVHRRWLRANIQAHGPLGALYPTPIFIMEGDTPSFLNLVGNGLSVPERPDWGGWGGRWEQPSPAFGHWADSQDSVRGADGKEYRSNKATIWRWRQAFQNDFAARMIWSVTPRFADANHHPRVMLNGTGGLAPLRVSACPGEPVALSAEGSHDPDGQAISYRWWQYREPSGLWSPEVKFATSEGARTTVTVPAWTVPPSLDPAAGFSFHVILEATDSGTPALSRYRRAIIDVPADGRSVNGRACPRIPAPTAHAYVDYDNAPPPSLAPFSIDSEIGELLAHPASRAIIERLLPDLVGLSVSHPQVRGMSVRILRNFDPRLTVERTDALDAELAKLPAPGP